MTFSISDYIKQNEGLSLVVKPDAHNTWQIGYGRNLSRKGISQEEADFLFEDDLPAATDAAATALGQNFWIGLDPIRQGALTDMAYELGPTGIAEFKDMLAAIRAGQWQLAQAACLDSDYGKEVPERAGRNAAMLLTGNPPV